MKKIFFYCTVLFMALLVTTSCNNDDDHYYVTAKYWEDYGTVETPTAGGHYVIRRDDGAKLIVVSNNSTSFEDKIGQRYYMRYAILEDKSSGNVFEKTYDISLTAVVKILTKGVVAQSFINSAADSVSVEDSLGNDPILYVDRAWFGGKFLNINFSYPYSPALNVAHMISLVYDDVTLDENGNTVLTLRQNAFEDVPGLLTRGQNSSEVHSEIANNETEWVGEYEGFYYTSSRVAFDISSIIPEGQTSAKIILKWSQYSDSALGQSEIKSSTSTFTFPTGYLSKSTEGSNILVDGSEFGLDKSTTTVE